MDVERATDRHGEIGPVGSGAEIAGHKPNANDHRLGHRPLISQNDHGDLRTTT